MAYGVYYRQQGSKTNYSRVGEWRKSSKCRIGERFIDARFETEQEAIQKSEELKSRGYETKIKAVK